MTTFLVDLDSVCNDLWGYIFDKYYEETGIRYIKAMLRDWDFRKMFPKDFVDWVGKFVSRKGFFKDVYMKKDCDKVLKMILDRGDKIFLVSAHASHPFSPRYYYSDKICWIKQHLPFINPKRELIFSSSKNQVMGDVLVDDSPRNLLEFDRITIVMDYPYNRHLNPNFRCTSWLDIGKVMVAISELLGGGEDGNIVDVSPQTLIKFIEDYSERLKTADIALRTFLQESLPTTVVDKYGKVSHPRNDSTTNNR